MARPVITGSFFRRRSFYAAWLPIGGLSLVTLGIGVAATPRLGSRSSPVPYRGHNPAAAGLWIVNNSNTPPTGGTSAGPTSSPSTALPERERYTPIR